jgi:hypothetical protein
VGATIAPATAITTVTAAIHRRRRLCEVLIDPEYGVGRTSRPG